MDDCRYRWIHDQIYVYQRKFEKVPENMKSFVLKERVVLNMGDHLHNRNHEVYMDNYVTTVPLLEHLKNVGLHACGTIKANRKFLPTHLKQDYRCLGLAKCFKKA